MKPRFNTRKSAGLIATAGLSLMLVGAGLSATFTDSGVASQSVAVGTFQIALSGDAGVVSGNGKSITFTAPPILSSAAAQTSMVFTVTNVGSIPVNLSVVGSVSGGTANFTALNGNPGNVTLAAGGTASYTGGIAWTELGMDDLGRTVTVTYTINAAG